MQSLKTIFFVGADLAQFKMESEIQLLLHERLRIFIN